MTTSTARVTVVLDVSGELDRFSAADFGDQLRDASGIVPAHFVVLDLCGVTFMDAAGLDAVIDARHALRLEGKDLQLRGIPPPVRRLMSRAGVTDVPPVVAAVPDLEPASSERSRRPGRPATAPGPAP